MCDSLQTQLGSSPMSPLGVVTDFITSLHPNPLRNGPVLLLFLSQELLDPEELVRRHMEVKSAARTSQPLASRWQRKEFKGASGGGVWRLTSWAPTVSWWPQSAHAPGKLLESVLVPVK